MTMFTGKVGLEAKLMGLLDQFTIYMEVKFSVAQAHRRYY